MVENRENTDRGIPNIISSGNVHQDRRNQQAAVHDRNMRGIMDALDRGTTRKRSILLSERQEQRRRGELFMLMMRTSKESVELQLDVEDKLEKGDGFQLSLLPDNAISIPEFSKQLKETLARSEKAFQRRPRFRPHGI